jgi:hypothetical protein
MGTANAVLAQVILAFVAASCFASACSRDQILFSEGTLNGINILPH